MNNIDTNQLIQQMRALSAQAQGAPVEPTAQAGDVSFGSLFAEAINSVNDTQRQSGALARAFEQGDPSVALADVMIAGQKSSVAFEAAVQVRNRLVEAYQQVMRMPI